MKRAFVQLQQRERGQQQQQQQQRELTQLQQQHTSQQHTVASVVFGYSDSSSARLATVLGEEQQGQIALLQRRQAQDRQQQQHEQQEQLAQNGLLREHVLAQQMEPVLLHHDRAIDLSQDMSPEAIDAVDEAMQKDEDAFAAHLAQVSLAMVSTECPEFTTGRGEAPWRDISGSGSGSEGSGSEGSGSEGSGSEGSDAASVLLHPRKCATARPPAATAAASAARSKARPWCERAQELERFLATARDGKMA
jgi:hypothetical protein